ncbi:MAG: 7,8-didemethyl-8-hydroxy-5-deazariboflavin synthase subunit CofG [Promethearchaeota archaeon]
MNEEIEIKELKKLNLKTLRERVKQIKAELPDEERRIITYSKNFTLSLSNYCVNQCGYCFYNHRIPKQNDDENLILINNTQIEKFIQKAIQFNCKEALIMSGENPESYFEVKKELEKRNFSNFIGFVKNLCLKLLDLNILPHTNLGLLTYDEMKELKRYNASMGLMLESTSLNLFKKGGVHEFSPGKAPKKRIQHIKNAGKLKIPFTTGLLIGIGESIEDIIRDLYLIKNIHNKYGHIQEVIIQNFVKKKGIPYQPKNPTSVYDILRITGIAQIILENEIAIQVPPNLITGYEKNFIEMGVDDFGGISPFTIDYINPENSWPQIDKLNNICRDEGYNLQERLPIYNKFLQKEGFCSENIKKIINNINLDD